MPDGDGIAPPRVQAASRAEQLTRIATMLASDGPLRAFVPVDPVWCLALPDAALHRLDTGAPLASDDEHRLSEIYRFALDRQIESLGGVAARQIEVRHA